MTSFSLVNLVTYVSGETQKSLADCKRVGTHMTHPRGTRTLKKITSLRSQRARRCCHGYTYSSGSQFQPERPPADYQSQNTEQAHSEGHTKTRFLTSRFGSPTRSQTRDWRSDVGGGVPCRSLPNQNASRVADQAEEHQKANEYVKQQQAQVPQPPVNTHTHTLCR